MVTRTPCAYEGRNHPRSVWYHMAAMRRSPEHHGWALERVWGDARTACTCKGVPTPDLAFLMEIDEFNGSEVWGGWKEAVAKAAKAVHVAAAIHTAQHRL